MQFKRQFGQNFLRYNQDAQKLIDAAEVNEHDYVIEIGCGDGRITNLLLQQVKKVLVIEVDYDLVVGLIKRFGDEPNLEIIHKDVLEVTKEEIVEIFGDQPYKVISSLPYNISKQIIRKFIEMDDLHQNMAFIIQEEVALSYAALPPKATLLGNLLQLYAEVKKGLTISHKKFVPSPQVNGAILTVHPYELDAQQTDLIEKTSQIMKIGFASPRKTLWNNLRANAQIDEQKLTEAFAQFNLEKQRPSELELETWKLLAAADLIS